MLPVNRLTNIGRPVSRAPVSLWLMPRRSADDLQLSADELTAALGGNITSTTAVAEVTRRLLDYFTTGTHFTTGTLQPGDRLPPERQLAASMGVGRSAIREALAALELLGVVDVRPGSGTYLRGRASELLPQTLSWGMLIGEPKTRELIDVRHALEVQAARLAAGTSNPNDIAELEDQLATMESHVDDDYGAFVAADMQFHQRIAGAADNALLEDLLQSVRSLIRVWVERALTDSDHARLACAEHQAVLEALRSHDADAAASAMSTHMETARRRLLGFLDTSAA
jgi:GntR family transcriptional regulator, transcriptional repressor for pyruvate dehydrogenase complex